MRPSASASITIVKNILDLMRYLMPLPVPQRWRRRMMALGSGHPTRIICSALIAQAFERVRYPILPKVTRADERGGARGNSRNPPFVALRAARFRHLALFRGGEADHSRGFDYKAMAWVGSAAAETAAGRRSAAPAEENSRRQC